jgi:hypothetical protein
MRESMLGRLVDLVVTIPVGILGILVDLAEKLLGPDQELWARELKKFLRREVTWYKVPPLRIWRGVEIGSYKKVENLLREISSFPFSNSAERLMMSTDLAARVMMVRVGLVTVQELTGKSRATMDEVYAVICDLGSICPAEVGPALREQYRNQPIGEQVLIAMIPIEDVEEGPRIFVVGHYHTGGLGFRTRPYKPDEILAGDTKFVVMIPDRPRKKS